VGDALGDLAARHRVDDPSGLFAARVDEIHLALDEFKAVLYVGRGGLVEKLKTVDRVVELGQNFIETRFGKIRERILELGFSEDQIIIEETFNDYETSLSVVRNAIEQHPNLRGVYMANLSVSGCAEAIRITGKKGKIRVVCHDINESIRQMLLDGSVDFTIPQDMVQQGFAPLLLLRDYIRKGTLSDTTYSGGQIRILCAENLSE
jgi:hypothetical protein